MDRWAILGVFLLGIGSGALLTMISFVGRLREIKAQQIRLHRRTPSGEPHAEWTVEKEISWWEMARRN